MRRAFTLIEMMLVVLLIGALAGAAAMSFVRPLRAAIEQIRAFDATARQVARRSGREVEIVIDPYYRQLVRREEGRDISIFRLPDGLRIKQVRTSGNARQGSELTLAISPHGWSRSYALRLVGHEFDRWLLVAGMSGQVTVIEDESHVQDILSRTSTARRDAD